MRRTASYGGIECLKEYVEAGYGSGWIESKAVCVPGIESFTQSELSEDANNCTLASITRVMRYYHVKGYGGIPSDTTEIYRKVREIGVAHGYDPNKAGLFRSLFVYTPWDIDNMVRDAWKAFSYPGGTGTNIYLHKLRTIKDDIDKAQPPLLNIVSGYYRDHTVSVIGYRVFSRQGHKDKPFVQVYDGWSHKARYIDWARFGCTLAGVTTISPP